MRLYGRWTVTLPGETYAFEPDEVTLGEQLMIETEAETSFDEWINPGISEGRAVPCQILVWFLRRKAGRQEERIGIDFPIRHLQLVAAEEVDLPNSLADSAQSEAATSPTSPDATESDPGNLTGLPASTS